MNSDVSPTISEQWIRKVISLGLLFRETLRVLRGNWKLFVTWACVWTACGLAHTLIFDIVPGANARVFKQPPFFSLALLFADNFLYFIIESLISIVVIILADAAIREGKVKTEDALARSFYLGPRYITTMLLFFAFFLLGFLAVIIPAIIIMVYFNFAAYFAVLYRKYNFKALGLSRQIVGNRWWAVFGRILIPNMVGIALSILTAVLTSGEYLEAGTKNVLLYLMTLGPFIFLSVLASIFLIIFELILMNDLMRTSSINLAPSPQTEANA